jgi:hypothetical protein
MHAMLRRMIETLGLRSDAAKSRLAELKRLLEEGGEHPSTHEPQHFAKVRPLPVHTGRSKHGGAEGRG